jgi:ATP-dependent RNA circularization protein (DNA/RNA ligase family)
MDAFFKFPSTPHLVVDGVDVREDKVMSSVEAEAFLCHPLVVEEKVDGSNLGISFDANGDIRLQNRGNILHEPFTGQWKKLDSWLRTKSDILFDILTDRYILFGEWCYAKHSVSYSKLPDWFLGFDVLDKLCGRFLSTGRRNLILNNVCVSSVPHIARGVFTLLELKEMLAHSALGDQLAEGLYLRHEDENWLLVRSKLVRPGFTTSIQLHWSKVSLISNKIQISCNNGAL